MVLNERLVEKLLILAEFREITGGLFGRMLTNENRLHFGIRENGPITISVPKWKTPE